MRALLAGPLAVLALVVLLLSLPVSLPLALIRGAWQDSRQRFVADRTCCVRCGHILGTAALHAADAAHMAEIDAMRRQYPHGTVTVLRRADACCTECGATYAWARRQGLLRPVEAATGSSPA